MTEETNNKGMQQAKGGVLAQSDIELLRKSLEFFIKNSNESTKRNILKWTTGFNSLDENGFDNSLFTISKNLGHTENHLPQVHTCSLILQLPEYDSYNTLVDKFNIAMGERNFGII